ncbi:MAG: hypothetical protein JWP40_458 [Blastococcus sp.]|jgi:hypothetical protein|nr:hypothetical protein [Blastococcus sp.]
MTPSPVRAAAVLLPVLVVCACSFRGSVTDAQAGSTATHSPGTSAGTGATTGRTSGGTPTTGAVGLSTTTADRPPAGGSANATGGGAGRVDRCHTSELTGRLVTGGAAAGNRYATLVLRNTGGQQCTVHGYGGLGLVDSSGRALPTRQVRAGSPAPATVLLTPGTTVSAQLHWGAVPGPGDTPSGDCQPAPATLRVIPPDETDPLSVPWNLGSVCEGGTIDQRAYTR